MAIGSSTDPGLGGFDGDVLPDGGRELWADTRLVAIGGSVNTEVGGLDGDVAPDGGRELWADTRLVATGGSITAPLFVRACDFGRAEGSTFTLPRPNWLPTWELTAETGDRGERMAGVLFLGVM